MQKVEFWAWTLRTCGRAAADTAAWFNVDLRTLITGSVLLALGLFLFFKVRGLEQVQQQIANSWLLVGFPTVLFVAALMVWHLFRAPYLIYEEEYAKASAAVAAADNEKAKAVSYAAAVKEDFERIPALNQEIKEQRDRADRAEAALAASRAATPPPSSPKQLTAAECALLAQYISGLDQAAREMRAQRMSPESIRAARQLTEAIGEWIGQHVGPAQKQAFLSAPPSPMVYDGMPGATGGNWQGAQGRLAYLRTLVDGRC
jgi:hypothetical protein